MPPIPWTFMLGIVPIEPIEPMEPIEPKPPMPGGCMPPPIIWPGYIYMFIMGCCCTVFSLMSERPYSRACSMIWL